MEYIKLLENHIDYEDLVNSGTMEKPNVSHCIQDNHVHYNKYIEPLIAKYYGDEEIIEDDGPYTINLYYYKNSTVTPISE